MKRNVEEQQRVHYDEYVQLSGEDKKSIFRKWKMQDHLRQWYVVIEQG